MVGPDPSINNILLQCGIGGQTNPPPYPAGCSKANDARSNFEYSNNWVLTTSNSGAVKGTTHFTSVVGSMANVTFTGMEILAMGVLLPTDNPDAAYFIDGQGPLSGITLSTVGACTRNQLFFHSQRLPRGNHTLTINVTQATTVAPYILDYVFICDEALSSVSTPGGTTGPTDPPSAEPSHAIPEGAIIGAILGSVVFLLISAALVYLSVRRRRRPQRRVKFSIGPHPRHTGSWFPL
ncbi:hypothetical protein C8Q74DRAFT_238416 [Fomes fomentarius]|nr:hypothetical protein C8Q74DRAFT_238416 [Fomes fomentarius]